jgi:hypothetical protein
MMWQSGDLRINADCEKGGSVTVTVLEPNGRDELPGFGASAAIPYGGNSTAAAVSWRSGATMNQLAGKPVTLAVTLGGNAKLFSLRGAFSWVSKP